METTSAQYDKLLSEICQWLKGHRITQLRVLALWIMDCSVPNIVAFTEWQKNFHWKSKACPRTKCRVGSRRLQMHCVFSQERERVSKDMRPIVIAHMI